MLLTRLLEWQVFLVAKHSEETTHDYKKYAPMKYLALIKLRFGREVMSENRSRAMCTIRIPEMDDLSRLEKARAVASRLEGVVKSEADHTLQMLTIEYDPQKITLEEIRNAVRGL